MSWQHGTTGGYTNHDCRCAECRAAWTAYNKQNRERRLRRGQCIQCSRPRHGTHVRCRKHYDALPRRTAKRLHHRLPAMEKAAANRLQVLEVKRRLVGGGLTEGGIAVALETMRTQLDAAVFDGGASPMAGDGADALQCDAPQQQQQEE